MNATEYLATKKDLHKVLMYGAPKTGKTVNYLELAKLPNIKKIVVMDLEKSTSVLRNPEIQKLIGIDNYPKIEVVNIPDLSNGKEVVEAMRSLYRTKQLKVSATYNLDFKVFDPSTVFVFDTLSSSSESILSHHKFERLGLAGVDAKPERDDYQFLSSVMTAFHNLVKSAQCHIISVTHETTAEETEDAIAKQEDKKAKVVEAITPWVGTRVYSKSVGKDYSEVIRTKRVGPKYVLSSKGSLSKIQVGGRSGTTLTDSLLPLFTI